MNFVKAFIFTLCAAKPSFISHTERDINELLGSKSYSAVSLWDFTTLPFGVIEMLFSMCRRNLASGATGPTSSPFHEPIQARPVHRRTDACIDLELTLVDI